jgi:DNA-binding MarR family transcriptional regulator
MSKSKIPAVDDTVFNEITQHCLLTRTRRISRVLTSIYDQELRLFGINSPQFTLLVIIFRLDGASRAEIGRHNHQDRSTLTRNLQLILSEGWVDELTPASGGRSRPIVLTEAGKDLLRTAAPAWRRAQAQAQRLLGKTGAAAVIAIAESLNP